MKFIRTLFVSLVIVVKIQANPYSFNHFQVENGLSNNSVLCSLQDDKGFMWFGTKDGLNRFDGYTYKVFRTNNNVLNSLGSNIIYSLHKDRDQVLWIGTERGLYQYDGSTESFKLLKFTYGVDITRIQSDNDGNLWFIGSNNLYKYDKRKSHITYYKDVEHQATALLITKNNTLWVATINGLIRRYDYKKNYFTLTNLFNHSLPTTSKTVKTIFEIDSGQLLIGTTNQGVKEFNIIKNTYKDIISYNKLHDELFVRDFIKQSNNVYWIATESGIYVYNNVTKKYSVLTKEYNNPYSLSDNAIYTFCKDKEGGIWAGSYFGGLNYFAKPYSYFEKFFPGKDQNSLTGNAVREIHPDGSNTLWIGTEDAGLNKFSISSEKFCAFKPRGKQKSVSNLNVHGLLIKNGKIWIGTFEHGLDVIDIKSGRVIQHFSSASFPYTLKSNFFYGLYETPSSNIVASTGNGLYLYDQVKKDFAPMAGFPEGKFYTSVYEDKLGTLWVGSYRDGLYYYNPKTKIHGSYINAPSDNKSLPNNRVNSIFEDSNDHLWFATEEGLCTFSNKKGQFDRYTTSNGLLSNVIYSLLEDAHKNLWISTSKGLACLNIRDRSIFVYTKDNGLLSDQFNYNSSYKDPKGNMYFGCLKGMIRFNPDKFIKTNYLPPVYITGFQVNNKELQINKDRSPLKKSILYTDTIVLNDAQSSFSIDFAALSYTSSQMTQYAYKMEGLERNWTFIQSNRKVYFTKLTAGNYIFNVKANSNSRIWNNKNKRFYIIIMPPFWATNYAYAIYLLAVAGSLVLFIRRYHYIIQKRNSRKIKLLENEKEKEIYEAKIAFFTNVAHEIRTPLTLISGPLERVIKRTENMPDVKAYLNIMERNTDRLLSLTNQLLDFRKTEIDGFSLSFVKTDINELIQDNLLRFSSILESKGFNLQIKLPPHNLFAYVDVEALNKILSNLLDNAIKYSVHNIYLQLLTNLDANQFTLLIKNDGNVISYDMKDKIFETFFRMKGDEMHAGSGIGLPLARYLTELHKGKLNLQPSQENLNVFALVIPIHQEIEFNI